MRRFGLFLCVSLLISPYIEAADTCTYNSYRWNTLTRQAEDLKTISKAYTELSIDEIDPQTGCSVCIEDQRTIKIGNLEPVRVCKIIANQINWVLNTAIAEGFPIRQLRGYRVGRTRGDVDAHGKRMGFSNHAFGIAIDVNAESNGLYENCMEFGEQCVLRRGGKWQPDENPQSISRQSLLVRLMKDSGLKWGGEIFGKQKDFMHFSPSGY
jgi:hypothetical protein